MLNFHQITSTAIQREATRKTKTKTLTTEADTVRELSVEYSNSFKTGILV